MKLKPGTIALVVAAALLGGVVLILQRQEPPTAEADNSKQPIFAVQERQIQAFTLQNRLRTLKFERNSSGKWQMLEPDKGPASDATVAYLLDLISAGKSDRSFTAPAANFQDYGFHQPLATIDLKLDNQQTHRLILGDYDFNRSAIYAQVDPPNPPGKDIRVLLVSPNFENAVNRPAAEWKQAAPSPSPSSSPSAGPSGSPSGSPPASPSPEASASPSASPSPEASSSPAPEAPVSPSPEAPASPESPSP